MTGTHWSEQTAIVTGAGGGIGLAIAERFAEAGAEVVVAEVHAATGQRAADDLQQR